MKQLYTYDDCYKILKSNPNYSWKQIRKAYKLQIQSWHPDRFSEGTTEEKNAAEIKVKKINKAYQQLSNYYRKNGNLPSTLKQSQDNSSYRTQKNTPQSDHQTQSKPSPSDIPFHTEVKQQKKPAYDYKLFSLRRIIAISIAIFLIYYLYNTPMERISTHLQFHKADDSNNIKNLDYNIAISPPQNNLNQPPKTSQNNQINEANIEPKVFTYGSSMSDVIMIQGVPTKTDGDIWYYGKSTVHFQNGSVKYWTRKPGTPLHAEIK